VNDLRERFAFVLGTFSFDMSKRDGRWLALTPDHVAFAVDDYVGWRRLQQEDWLLSKWRSAGAPVPRVLRSDASRHVQVRERMHGLTGRELEDKIELHPDVRERLRDTPLSPFGARLAASYGELAARFRRAVEVPDAHAAGLSTTSHRAVDVDAAISALEATDASSAAKRAARRARDWLVELPPINAVIHSDLHFFNMCTSPAGDITGVFDLGDSGIDTAETELLYAHSLGSQFLRTALDAYGQPLDEKRIIHAHLRTALDHIVFHGPGTERHESIVAWATAAFELLV
jgi:aminoglycoside phosphotransferase (APT) family kinase protein